MISIASRSMRPVGACKLGLLERPSHVSRLLSTRELADALGVSESSIKRWIDAGKITASRTDGGHRRIERSEALRFLRESRMPLVHPEVLDLAHGTGSHERLIDCLLEGDAAGARSWLAARYLEGASAADLADGPIREAMHALGEIWRHDDAGIFIEHRATDACIQAIAHLRGVLPVPAPRAPCAVGGALAGDPYMIASQLAAMVAIEGGMRATNLGPDVPVPTLERAVTELRAKLVWVTGSVPIAPARVSALARFIDELPRAASVVVGGRETAGWKLPDRVVRAASMTDLAACVRSIMSRS